MQVVIKRPGQLPLISDLVGGDMLKELQTICGGYIEQGLCHDTGDHYGVMWCDADGHLKQPDPGLNFFRPADGHPIVGPVVVTGMQSTINGMDFGPLSDEAAAIWMWMLSHLHYRAIEAMTPDVQTDEVGVMRELHSKLGRAVDRELVVRILSTELRRSTRARMPRILFVDIVPDVPSLDDRVIAAMRSISSGASLSDDVAAGSYGLASGEALGPPTFSVNAETCTTCGHQHAGREDDEP